MQLNFIKFLLKLLKFRPKLYHLLIVFAPLVVLFRFNHLVDFSQMSYKEFQEKSISLGKTAHASAADTPSKPVADADTPPKPAADANKAAPKGFDPLTLDENQIKVLQAMAEEKSKKPADANMQQMEKLVHLGQEKIAEQVAKLEKIKADLEKKKGVLTKEEIQNLTQTAKIYENMKPIEAAEIFNKLELIVLVQIIKHMNTKKASMIMAKMDPKKSRYLTIELLRADQIAAPAA